MGRKFMGEYRSKMINKNNNEKVVKIVAIPQAIPRKNLSEKESGLVMDMKKKKSALEISNSIGIYGAFGRTLSDLHKQGR
jgi:hypothetical protein